MFGAVAEDQRLATAGDAVDDAVAFAEAAGQLFLLQVHDADDVGDFRLLVVKQAVLRRRGDADFGKQVPADAVDLRQGERDAARKRQHAPQAFLEGFGIDAFGHFVLADDAVGFDDFAEVGALELLAADVGKHDAVAPREEQRALHASAIDGQLRVALQKVADFVGVLPGLFERVGDALEAVGGQDAGALAVDFPDGVELPVLDLEHQQAAARVENDEVGMHVARAERYVVPEQPVVFELLLEAVGQAPLAARHARDAGADCRYQRSHCRPLMLL